MVPSGGRRCRLDVERRWPCLGARAHGCRPEQRHPLGLIVRWVHGASVRGGTFGNGSRSGRHRRRPHDCARHDPLRVFVVCPRGHPDWHDSVGAVNAAVWTGAIDPPSNLEWIRGWVLAEEKDPIVGLSVVEAAGDFLRAYAGNRVQFQELSGAGHSIPTAGHGGPCAGTGGSVRRLPKLVTCSSRRAAGEGGATCMLQCMDAGKAPPGRIRKSSATRGTTAGLLCGPKRRANPGHCGDDRASRAADRSVIPNGLRVGA
jgi:hypothetical protein